MFVSNVVRAFSHGVKVCGYNGRSSSIVMLICLCLLSGGTALAQAKVTVESEISKSGSLVLEVRGVDNASVSATPVERISPNGKQLYCAYDIDITKDGREWQPEPEQPAMVSMENTNFADGQLLDIYHEGANGLEFVATVASENGKITFPAHSFSVYIVAQAGDYARLKVNLHQADGTVVTIYVKKLDLTQGNFNRIVYNPGMGTDNLAAGVKCMGWVVSADGNYTVADTANALSFDGVRDRIRTQLNNGVTDGTELNFYAMLFKLYSVTYLGENNSVYETDELLYRADAATSPAISYTVNANYTPGENSRNFEGWKVNSSSDGSHISGHSDNDHNYTNLTDITVTGDVAFKAHVTEGHWLIYHENGHGATYKAADFIHAGDPTARPTLTMLRNGYTFAGWYESDANGNITGTNPFVFGNTIETTTHLGAKWNPVASANYTVIIWKQNLDCTGYDFEQAITLSGSTNSIINTVQATGNGNARYASVDGTAKQYTGFYLDHYNQNVRIAPEGDALVNIYYDRIEYTVKFIYCRKDKNANNYYYAKNGDGTASTMSANWQSSGSNHPTCTYYDPEKSYTDRSYTYYYYPITAKYGQSIVEQWPREDKFPNFRYNNTDYNQVSWILMIGALDRTASSRSVKGVVPTMDEHILGNLTSSDGNYLVARYDKDFYYWTYNIWFPKVDGEDYSGATTTTHGGYEYYLSSSIPAKSGKNTADGQHQPTFSGYGVASVDPEVFTRLDDNNYKMDYYYTREVYTINYMNGAKYDGNGNHLEDLQGQLKTTSNIAYLADIRTDGNYRPANVPAGYVFEGWYADKPCSQLYNFNRMPKGGVTVYAKWRQIQYRVFLHPNANPDVIPDLDWGSSNQALNFRITCGNHLSAPTGVSEEYEFVGWYTNSECTQAFNESAFVLNETSVTEPYDKTTDFTDDMDKYGNGATYNKDITGNDGGDRFWITKKLDLYGKWRAKLRGADGITVIYVDNMETPTTIDTARYYYQDNVKAIARDAIPSRDANKEFSHWVLQNFNSTDSVYEDIPGSRIFPGDLFSVLKDNSKRVVTNWYNPQDIEDLYSGIVNPNVITSPDATHTEYGATYTIYLRAEYVDVEQPEHTFIEWFWNDGTNTVQIDGSSISSPDLGINVAVNPPVPTRTGYNFKGWYRSNESGATITDCEPNFLFYNDAFYKESAYTNAVTTVAADKYGSPEYMYAIWEPIVDFTFGDLCPGDQIVLPTRNSADVLISGSWEAITGYVSGTTYTTSALNDHLTFTPDPSTCAQTKDFAITINTPDVPNVSSYDYIWKGTSTDWNTASNWYVYNNGYSIATEMPTEDHNIYIGPSQCVKTNWPLQTDEANAHDITIASGANLTVPAGKTLNITGNLDNIGTLVANGNVVFSGTESGDDQVISNDITLANVSFNNRGGDIVPRGSMTITGDATFINGNVEGDVTFGENSSVENADEMTFYSFVDGTVTKAGNANGFTFPTGQTNVLGKIKVLSNASNVSVRYFHNSEGFDESEYPRWWNPNNNCDGNDPRFDHVSNLEYWNVASTAPLNATLTVSAKSGDAHFNEHTVTYDAADIYGAFWNGSCWENVGGGRQSVSDGLHGTISVDVTLPATRSTYGKILSLGSIDHNTILPIELMSFTAACNGRYVNLEWTTATERNNDYFIVERSDDAINFTEIARVAGAGNSIEQLDYNYTDYSAAGGDNYYRLVQVDYDGTRTASEIVVANCSEAEGEPDVQVFPNPFHNDLTIHMENFGGTIVSIEVYDMLGRIVMQKTIGVDGSSEETMLQLDNLSNGTYNVRISTKELVINKQVVKN